jgi:hypothetical protein
MKWHDWRKICTENNLSKEETSKSWSEYKEMVKYAEEAALLGILSDEFLIAFAYARDNRFQTDSQLDELTELSKSINDTIDEKALFDEVESEDEKMFIMLEKTQDDLMLNLEHINDKAEYYSNKALELRQSANSAILDMSDELRKYKR